jgi:hypothetical protein
MFGLRRGDRAAKTSGGHSSVSPTVSAASPLPMVPLTWIQAPTLAETNGMTPLSGTSFYQEAIASIKTHLGTSRPPTDLFTIQMAVVPDGPYAGSVAVYANGQRVATLPAGMNPEYAPVVRAVTDSGSPATCRAVLAGVDNDRPTIGVWALLPTHASAATGAQFLPPYVGRRVTVAESTAVTLDAAIKSKAKTTTDRRIGVIDPATGDVALDGSRIGTLPSEAHASMLLVAAAAAAGYPTRCQLRLIREPGKALRVVADLP